MTLPINNGVELLGYGSSGPSSNLPKSIAIFPKKMTDCSIQPRCK